MAERLVLIVDDSPVVRRMLAGGLEAEGFRCLEASNGAEGAVLAITHRPDVVVTDLEMPVMDGFQLARLLKSDEGTSGIPVVVLTSHGEASSRFWSLHTGADRFVTKSEDFGPVIQAVKELAGSNPRSALRHREAEDEAAPGPLEIIGRVARQLDERLLETTVAQNLLERGVASESLTEAVDGVLEVLETVVDAAALAILVADGTKPAALFLRRRAGTAVVQERGMEASILEAAGLGTSHPAELVELSPLRERFGARSGAAGGETPLELFRLPLRNATGALAVVPLAGDSPDAVPHWLLANLAAQIGLVLDNARLSERLRELSTLDGLTGLLNHRAVLQRLEQEMARCRRYGGDVTVVLLDLDHFKEINDRWGHLAGDEVLREVGSRLKGSLRSADLVGRYGGEEFLMILPAAGLETGRIVAERLRRTLADAPVVHGGHAIPVTASLGVASLGEAGGGGPEEILSLADERLYQAKREGRNCVRP